MPVRLLAILAKAAYGDGVRFWTGFNATKPLKPSLNQIRNCKFGCVNSDALMAVMFATVVSPKTTVNRPLVMPTVTTEAGGLPVMLVPSLLQKVTYEMFGGGGAIVTVGVFV